MTAIAILRKAEIIEHVAAGKRISDLNLGITRQSISEALVSDPDYRAAITAGHIARLDAAEAAIEAAEPPDVPRARALWTAVAWRAEREAPHRWGAKQEVTHRGQAPILQVTIVSDPRNTDQVLDCEPLSSLPAELPKK